MKGFYLVIIGLGYGFWVCAQNNNLEHAESLLSKGDYVTLIPLCDQLLESEAEPSRRSRLYQLKADAHYFLNDLQSAINNYAKAVNEGLMSREPPLVVIEESLGHTGYCYRELGQYDSALYYYNRALQMSLEMGDSVEIANHYSNFSRIYGLVGNTDLALEYLHKAYEIDLARRDTFYLGFTLRNFGEIQMQMGEPQKALQSFKESLIYLEKSQGNHNSYAIRLNNVGQAYLALDNIDSASHYIRRSLTEHSRLNDSLFIAERWIDLSRISNRTDNAVLAIDQATRGKLLLLRLGDESRYLNANIEIIRARLQLRDLNVVADLLDPSLVMARSKGLLITLRALLSLQKEYAELINDDQLADTADAEISILTDSLVNMDNQRAALELEKRIAVDNVIIENERLKKENLRAASETGRLMNRFNITIIGISALILVLLGITWKIISSFRTRQQRLMLEIDDLRVQLKGLLEGDVTKAGLDKDKLNAILNDPLSDREFEILHHAISDLNNSEIAEKVYVSVNTVKFHLKNIYHKLGVSNRKEALQVAIASKG